MSYVSQIQKGDNTYPIRDKRIASDALDSASQGDILIVNVDGSTKTIGTQTPSPDGMVLDATNNKITQNSVDVTNDTKTVLGLPSKADLVDGKVPVSQLPSYVNEIINSYIVGSTPFASDWLSKTEGGTPLTPEDSKIYVILTSGTYEGRTYRWSGLLYVEISPSLALGETSSTAYRGDRGKIAYDHTSLVNNPHQVTAQQLGAVKSINTDLLPDSSGNVVVNEVPYADNLNSVDNSEDLDTYIFRTSGGSASLSTGPADVAYFKGHSVVTGLDETTKQATSITIAKPTQFKSTLFNAFNQYDTSMVFPDTSISFDNEDVGTFVSHAGTYACIVHVVGGVVAGNGNKGYTAAWLESENTPIAGIDTVLTCSAWYPTKPVGTETTLTKVTPTWINNTDGYGKRANYTLTHTVDGEEVDFPSGYLIIVCSDIEHLVVHPRWSGYMDGSLAQYLIGGVTKTYKDSRIDIPTTDTEGTSLPTASYGFPSMPLTNGTTLYDELYLSTRTYTKRIGYYPYSAENLATVQALTQEYIYDSATILYQLASPVTYTLASTVDSTYDVDDFGTEEFLYETNSTLVSLTADHWYGQNLVDKLRTDVVTISAQALTTSQQTQVRTNIDAVGQQQLGASSTSSMVGVATLNTSGVVPMSQLPDVVMSVNNELPDSAGNVTLDEVPFAENLVSPDNTTDTGSYIFRTSGGEASVSDGEAQVTIASGNSANPTRSDESFNITVTDTIEGTNCSITIDKALWRNNAVVGWTPGTYVFTYSDTEMYEGGDPTKPTHWSVSSIEAGLVNVPIVLSGPGVTVSGTPAANDTITTVYTRVNSASSETRCTRQLAPTVTASTYESGATTKGFTDVVANYITFTYVETTTSWTGVQKQNIYDETASYEVGDIVAYRASSEDPWNTYTCNTAILGGETWNPLHWTLKDSNTDSITVTGIALADMGMATASGVTLYRDDKLVVTCTRTSVEGVVTLSASVVATPKCYVTISNFDLSVWFATTSFVRNMLGPDGTPGAFVFTFADGNWSTTINSETLTYTRSQLESTFGITYTVESSTAGTYPQENDKIYITPSIITTETTTFTDYVGYNDFSASFGINETQITANKALWRSAIDTYGSATYKFIVNDNEAAWTLRRYTDDTTYTVLSSNCDPVTYGVVVDGTAGRRDIVTVVYVKLVAGTYYSSTPTHFKSVGTQQFKYSNFVTGYKLNSTKTAIEAGTSTDYIAWVHVCYANAQGWTVYSANGGLESIAWSTTPVDTTDPTTTTVTADVTERTDLGGTTYDTSGTYVPSGSAELINAYFEESKAPGYLIIYMTEIPATNNTSGSLCVHPRWSGYKNLVTGYDADTNYDDHTTTLQVPQYGIDSSTETLVELPIHAYGMPKVGAIADEIQFDRNRYIKKILREAYSASRIAELIAAGIDYIYDSSYIYSVLTTSVVYSLVNYVPPLTTYYTDTALTIVGGTTASAYQATSHTTTYSTISISGTNYYVPIAQTVIVEDSYVICDFGTEEYLGTTVNVTSSSLYGQNLRDKLRTDVLTISEQTLTTSQQEQVKENLNIAYSNPNLLDNPWFTVNQRGITTTTATGYHLDRWRSGGTGSIEVTSSGIIVTADSESVRSTAQYFSASQIERGQYYTVSAIIDGVLYSGTGIIDNRTTTWSRFFQCQVSSNVNFCCATTGSSDVLQVAIDVQGTNASCTIKCVKLERGSVSTLAMDTAPDYGTEVIKCMSSTADSSDTYANMPMGYTGRNYPRVITSSTSGFKPNVDYVYNVNISSATTLTIDVSNLNTNIANEWRFFIYSNTATTVTFTSSSGAMSWYRDESNTTGSENTITTAATHCYEVSIKLVWSNTHLRMLYTDMYNATVSH